MMPECWDSIPSERLRVFISSSQRDENGYKWSELRRQVKDTLSKCVYLNPFIIEDNPSATPSLQFFQREVQRADLVIILIKGDVRPGTSQEYALAAKEHKPFWVYFIDDDNPNISVAELKRDIQNHDYCTYRQIKASEPIDVIIRSDIMREMVRAYQDSPVRSVIEQPETTVSLSDAKDTTTYGIPTQELIKRFKSCYKELFDLLDFHYHTEAKEQSELHNIGCALIKWLWQGKFDIPDDLIVDLLQRCDDMFPNAKWLRKRWDAIRNYEHDNLPKALDAEKQALDLARQSNVPAWIIGDILIDCRNLDGSNNKLNHKVIYNGEYQQQLDQLDSTVYVPLLDRYACNIREQMYDDEFRIATASPHTILMGTGIEKSLTELMNYLFVSALYGSFTHLQITRKLLAQLLGKYALLTHEYRWQYEALRQYVLFGSAKDCKPFLDANWDTVYPFVSSQADELWALSDQVRIADKERMKLIMIQRLGLYFGDSVFSDVEEFLFTQSGYILRSNSDDYLLCIDTLLPRLSPQSTAEALIQIISNHSFFRANRITRMICRLDFDNISRDTLASLAHVINENLESIIQANGDPQMISVLVRYDRDLFHVLEENPSNGLRGIQRTLYDINMGSSNWIPLLQKELDSAKASFEQHLADSVIRIGSDPYSMISHITQSCPDNSIDTILLESFIPHLVQVIPSKASTYIKDSCFACACHVLTKLRADGMVFPDELFDTLRAWNISEQQSDRSSFDSKKSLEIRTLMIRIICGLIDEQSILQWCLGFRDLEHNEREAVADCVEAYLNNPSLQRTDSLIISMALQCMNDTSWQIRCAACRCIVQIIRINQNQIATNALLQAVYDPSDNVRVTLLNSCSRQLIQEPLNGQIIQALTNDANYRVRKRALELVSQQQV